MERRCNNGCYPTLGPRFWKLPSKSTTRIPCCWHGKPWRHLLLVELAFARALLREFQNSKLPLYHQCSNSPIHLSDHSWNKQKILNLAWNKFTSNKSEELIICSNTIVSHRRLKCYTNKLKENAQVQHPSLKVHVSTDVCGCRVLALKWQKNSCWWPKQNKKGDWINVIGRRHISYISWSQD